MTSLSHQRRSHRRRAGHNPLAAPLTLFGLVMIVAVAYVGYVLWPRWPETPVAHHMPALPIVVAGVDFNIEPAAIRRAIQRRAGTQARVELSYLWPSLAPPGQAVNTVTATPIDPNRRLFVTIQNGEATLPIAQRVKEIYPRYLVAAPSAEPDGLTRRRFRDGTPYQGEELVFESNAPEHFLARCSLRGIANSGTCLLERRIGQADITFRFPRAWLKNWRGVGAGIDKLLARLHPG